MSADEGRQTCTPAGRSSAGRNGGEEDSSSITEIQQQHHVGCRKDGCCFHSLRNAFLQDASSSELQEEYISRALVTITESSPHPRSSRREYRKVKAFVLRTQGEKYVLRLDISRKLFGGFLCSQFSRVTQQPLPRERSRYSWKSPHEGMNRVEDTVKHLMLYCLQPSSGSILSVNSKDRCKISKFYPCEKDVLLNFAQL